MKTTQQGFTLIELVIVLVILGLLAAVAVPRYVDLQGDALTASKAGMSGAVKSAHAISIADLKALPTVTQLATYVQAEGAAAVATGVNVLIDGTTYTVPTYSDSTCATATAAVADAVACVGSIP